MRARLFVPFYTALLAIVLLPVIAPAAAAVFGQQRGQGQRGAVPPGAQQQGQQQGRGGGRGNTPTFAGPPAGMQALPKDLFN